MSASEYGEILVLTRALKSYLLKPGDYSRLLEGGLEDFLAVLRETVYGKLVEDLTADERSVMKLETRLKSDYYQVLRRILDRVPKKALSFYTVLESATVVDLLKPLLIASSIGYTSPTLADYSSEVSKVLPKALNGDLKGLISMIRDEGLRIDIEKSIRSKLYGLMDVFAFRRLWTATDSLEENDKKAVRRLLGVKLDLLTIRAVLRAKRMKMDYEAAREAVTLVGYKIRPETFEEALKAETVEEAIEVFRNAGCYPDAVDVASRSLDELDLLIRKKVVEACRGVFSGYPFNAAIPLAYLELKQNEVANLITIANGKLEELSRAVIEKNLILY